MLNKFIITTAAMLLAITADCSIAPDTAQTPDTSERQTLASVPDIDRIKTDLIGRFMYVVGGSPGFWEFKSLSTIQHGAIGNTRQDGDLLEFNINLFLVDDKTKQQNLYHAETVVIYKKAAGSWELLKVQGNSITEVGTGDLTMQSNLQDEC